MEFGTSPRFVKVVVIRRVKNTGNWQKTKNCFEKSLIIFTGNREICGGIAAQYNSKVVSKILSISNETDENSFSLSSHASKFELVGKGNRITKTGLKGLHIPNS
jgi:hypothetical protein